MKVVSVNAEHKLSTFEVICNLSSYVSTRISTNVVQMMFNSISGNNDLTGW